MKYKPITAPRFLVLVLSAITLPASAQMFPADIDRSEQRTKSADTLLDLFNRENKHEKEIEEKSKRRNEAERLLENSQLYAIAKASLRKSSECQEYLYEYSRELIDAPPVEDFEDLFIRTELFMHPHSTPTNAHSPSEIVEAIKVSRKRPMGTRTSYLMYDKLKSTVKQSAEAYRDYKTWIKRVKRNDESIIRLEKMIMETSGVPSKKLELEYVLEKAKQDKNELNQYVSFAHQRLTDLAGIEAVSVLDKQLNFAVPAETP